MLEKDLERKLTEAVRARGGRSYKFTSPGNAGVPDRIVVLPGGRVGFVELKQAGGKPRRDQRLQMERLAGMGCVVESLDDPRAIPRVLRAIEGGGRDGV